MAFPTASPPFVTEADATQPVRDSGAHPLNVATSAEVGAAPPTQLPAVDHTPLPPAQMTAAPQAGAAVESPSAAMAMETTARQPGRQRQVRNVVMLPLP